MKKCIVFALICCAFLSCNSHLEDYPIEVNFYYAPSTPTAGELVQFSSQCSNVTKFRWSFISDSEEYFATEANPQKILAEGYWTVSLTGYSDDGRYESCTKSVYIAEAKPSASFTYTTPIYTGKTVTFKNTSKKAKFYEWYCDGNLFSTNTDAIKVFDYGIHNIKLIAYNSKGNKSEYSSEIQVHGLCMEIVSYKIESLDFEDSTGRYWDDEWSDGPDIFVRLFQDGVYMSETNHISDVSLDMIPCTVNVSFKCYYPFSDITVQFIDYDLLVNDDMFALTLKPQKYIDELPNKLYGVAGKSKIVFNIKWSLM